MVKQINTVHLSAFMLKAKFVIGHFHGKGTYSVL